MKVEKLTSGISYYSIHLCACIPLLMHGVFGLVAVCRPEKEHYRYDSALVCGA